MIHSKDVVAVDYSTPLVLEGKAVSSLAKAVYNQMWRTGQITGLDAMRGPLGISGGSLTRRISELKEAGIGIRTERKRDPITHRLYSVYMLDNHTAEHKGK